MAVAYYLGAELAFWIGTLSYFFAPLWPPNMILLAALLQAPYRAWWFYVAAALPAHIAAETQMGMQALPMVGAFACNVALTLCAAAGLRCLSKGPAWLDTLAKAWTFILVAAIGAPLLVSCGIAAIGWLSRGGVGGVEFAMRWGVANVLGGVALAPLFITWVAEGVDWLWQTSARHALEAALLAAALAAIAYIGFPASSAEYPVLACMPIPLMLWAAVRFGPRGASGAILVVSLMALAGAIQGRAPFAAATPEHTVLSLQLFLAVLAAPFLVLAAVVTERQHATSKARVAHEELNAILDNTPACIYVKDLQGRYIFANRSARALLGREITGRTSGELFPPETAASWLVEERSIANDGIPITKEEEVDRGGGRRHYLTTKFVLREGERKIYAVCVVSTDITEFRRAQNEVHDLSARLLTAQDEERRRIARELHDGTVQTLTAISLNLGRLLKSGARDPEEHGIVGESITLLKQAQAEIRTLTYLLHPPLLDELGLTPALKLYVEGFSKRTGIEVTLQMPPDMGGIESDIEMGLFRVVQESLSNVHRHADAKSAAIRLEYGPRELMLTISDTGRGIQSEARESEGDPIHSLGVGIAGMKARMQQLGGTLDVRSSATGTAVTATIPNRRGKGSEPLS